MPQQRRLKDLECERGGVPLTVLSQTDAYIKSDRGIPDDRSTPVDRRKDGDVRILDRTSMIMLIYPLVNLSVIMPLSVYRVMALAGKTGSPQALAACGSIFALGGLANTLLYTFSRVRLFGHYRSILTREDH